MENSLENRFYETFGHRAQYIFTAPGRTELGGNHTDHQNGIVLAAAVNMTDKAAAALNCTCTVRLFSEGFGTSEIDLSDLSVKEEEKFTTAALIRGIARSIKDRGFSLKGFDACITSDIPAGSGLSSSAAFEILTGAMFNRFCCDNVLQPAELAITGQYAENVYFGKPSGLLDQMTCALGGVVNIDFKNPGKPSAKKISTDFSSYGYSLCIINTGADHRGLTEDYALVTRELSDVCAVFGKKRLREVPEEEFYENIPAVRKACGDRALLRAIHVYDENRRAAMEADALTCGNFTQYLELVKASGASSWQYLQNVIPCGSSTHQEMAASIALCSHLLNGAGACRVQGGGFAGTVQAYVPAAMLKTFTEGIEKYLGKGSCTEVQIRSEGAVCEEC